MEIRRRNGAATEVCNFGGNEKPWQNVATSSSREAHGIYRIACVNESKERNTRRSYIHIKILDTSHKEVDLTLGNDITTTSSKSKGTHCQII